MKTQEILEYDENSIEVIEDDIERVRKSLTQYIGYTGTRGAIHLIKEIIQNGIDEDRYGCDTIMLKFDERSQVTCIGDNGRGIPIGRAIEIFTKLNSSGKYDRNGAYKFSSGIHGVGTTCTNALSYYTKVIISRDGKKEEFYFENGRFKYQKSLGKSNARGTIVEFKPNEKYLKDKINIKCEDVKNLIYELSYISTVKFLCELTHSNGKTERVKIYSPDGIEDCLHNLCLKLKDKMMIPVIRMYGEDFSNNMAEKTVDVAVTYLENSSQLQVKSYVNKSITIENGTHVQGSINGICRALIDFTKSIMTKKELTSYEPTDIDCMNGLCITVNANHTEPQFIGQVKEKVTNHDFTRFCGKVTYDGMKEWIVSHKKEALKIAKYIKHLAEIRTQGQLIRKTTPKIKDDPLDINSRKYSAAVGNEMLELFIVEGDSASGTANKARNKLYQEIFGIKGKSKDAYNSSYSQMSQNDEFKMLSKITGSGLGPGRNMDMARYDKIIFLPDADPDGGHISNGLAMIYLKHGPEYFLQGKIYKAILPLYKIKVGNKTAYLKDRKAYAEYMMKHISKTCEVFYIDGKKMNANEIKTLLKNNIEYLRILNRCSKRYAIEPTIVEKLILLEDEFHNNLPKFKKSISKQFPYMKLKEVKDGNFILSGEYKNDYHKVLINNRIYMSFSDVKNEMMMNIQESKTCEFIYDNQIVTIGELLNIFEKYKPNMMRFKGLGEMNADELAEAAFNPETRTLVRLTIDDVKEEISKFAILKSDKTEYVRQREALFKTFNITVDDLDT